MDKGVQIMENEEYMARLVLILEQINKLGKVYVRKKKVTEILKNEYDDILNLENGEQISRN